jgi:hypothetical protein
MKSYHYVGARRQAQSGASPSDRQGVWEDSVDGKAGHDHPCTDGERRPSAIKKHVQLLLSYRPARKDVNVPRDESGPRRLGPVQPA